MTHTGSADFVGSEEWRAYMPWFPDLTDKRYRSPWDSLAEVQQVTEAYPSVPVFVCPTCGRKSANRTDIAERYCAVCGFVDDRFRSRDKLACPEFFNWCPTPGDCDKAGRCLRRFASDNARRPICPDGYRRPSIDGDGRSARFDCEGCGVHVTAIGLFEIIPSEMQCVACSFLNDMYLRERNVTKFAFILDTCARVGSREPMTRATLRAQKDGDRG